MTVNPLNSAPHRKAFIAVRKEGEALIAAVEDPVNGVRFAGVPEIRDAGRRFHLR